MVKRDLDGRAAAITGASSGIGAATAVACGRRGMRMGLFARREERLREVAERVRAVGGEALVVAGDVRDLEAQRRLVDEVTARWGRLDAIVANAGFGIAARVAETPPAEVQEIFDVNVLGSIWSIQAAWPTFEAQERGHVVLVSSVGGLVGLPAAACYSGTKAAQAILADGLRIEADPLGIDVSVVYPIMTETEFVPSLRDHVGRRKGGRDRRQIGPRQTADEVAEAIVGCLERPRLEVHPFWLSRLVPWLRAISPRLVTRALGFDAAYRRLSEGGSA